jgi:hypothetical protein
MSIPSVLGTIDVLSEAEQREYDTCNAVIGSGWNAFVEVGRALAQVRDDQLYRCEFDSS